MNTGQTIFVFNILFAVVAFAAYLYVNLVGLTKAADLSVHETLRCMYLIGKEKRRVRGMNQTDEMMYRIRRVPGVYSVEKAHIFDEDELIVAFINGVVLHVCHTEHLLPTCCFFKTFRQIERVRQAGEYVKHRGRPQGMRLLYEHHADTDTTFATREYIYLSHIENNPVTTTAAYVAINGLVHTPDDKKTLHDIFLTNTVVSTEKWEKSQAF